MPNCNVGMPQTCTLGGGKDGRGEVRGRERVEDYLLTERWRVYKTFYQAELSCLKFKTCAPSSFNALK